MGGPLAYWAGAGLGAVEMPDAAAALIAQAIGWALMMPALMALAFRIHARGSAPRGVVVRAPGSVVLVSRPSTGG